MVGCFRFQVKWGPDGVTCDPAHRDGVPFIPNADPQKLNACPGTKHGLTCDIACKEGFAIHGFARATCNFGTFTSLPACAEEGQKILREKVVTGYLIFSADSADHLEGHATSTAFLEVLLDRQNFHFEFRIQI